ncbi:unnamed protein product, partial [Rotaria sp. Silwood1]
MDNSYTDIDMHQWDSFDDILINNALTINGKSIGCVAKSPMFWTCIVLGICAFILVIMGILYYYPKSKTYFKRLRCIFRQTDLIGDGKLWIGGLASFALIILVIYAFWFSSAFANLYPIEISRDANFACDTALRNSKFTSALQLLASKKSHHDAPMFQILDNQHFQLTVDFIQTGFVCNDIRVQEYVGSYLVDLEPNHCFRQEDNATSTLSVDLHIHEINIKFDLTEHAVKSLIYKPPSTWEPTKGNQRRFQLQITTDEYKSISEKFGQDMNGTSTKIIRIERIQNEAWYIQYLVHSREFQTRINEINEKHLYHGCPEESANKIIESWFNRSFAGVNGVVYGVGVYFSSNATYSHHYATPNGRGERNMFLARVLVGKTVL